MTTLTEFLKARIDEEHYLVQHFVYTDGGEWTADTLARLWWYSDPPKFRSATDPIIQHAARYNPARALREVEAKRAILAAYAANDSDVPLHLGDHPRKHGEWDGLRLAVRHLAAIYGDHPDYDAEKWAP